MSLTTDRAYSWSFCKYGECPTCDGKNGGFVSCLDLKKLEAEIDLFLENETEQSLNNLFKMTDSMKDTVIINGVEYVPKVVIEPAKVGRWKPEDGEQYFWVDWDGVSRLSVNENLLFDEGMLKMGNIYQTKALAIRARDRQLLLVELQDYADQKNEGCKMFALYHSLAKFDDDWGRVDTACIIPGTVRFRSSEDADAAIAHFGDRLDLLL